MITSRISPCYRQHLDNTWSWTCFVFAPRDRSQDDDLPPCVYVYERSAFALADSRPVRSTKRAAMADMKAALKLCGLDKAPTT